MNTQKYNSYPKNIFQLFSETPEYIPYVLCDPHKKVGIYLWVSGILGIFQQPQNYF